MSVTEPSVSGDTFARMPSLSQPSRAEMHRDRAGQHLTQFEASGDLRNGLAALIHAILSIAERGLE